MAWFVSSGRGGSKIGKFACYGMEYPKRVDILCERKKNFFVGDALICSGVISRCSVHGCAQVIFLALG